VVPVQRHHLTPDCTNPLPNDVAQTDTWLSRIDQLGVPLKFIRTLVTQVRVPAVAVVQDREVLADIRPGFLSGLVASPVDPLGL
jgi:hypothetical protein